MSAHKIPPTVARQQATSTHRRGLRAAIAAGASVIVLSAGGLAATQFLDGDDAPSPTSTAPSR